MDVYILDWTGRSDAGHFAGIFKKVIFTLCVLSSLLAASSNVSGSQLIPQMHCFLHYRMYHAIQFLRCNIEVIHYFLIHRVIQVFPVK